MANPVGAFIWYELMTTDPEGAAAFYGPIVGWNIAAHTDAQSAAGGMDYRMIGRSDGGFAGGVLKLNEQMMQGGARPTWIAYLYVEDVDAAVSAIVADGGASLMPAMDIEVGRIAMVTDPQGVPHYVMTPKPPANAPDASSDVYDRWTEQRVSWNELYSPDLEAAKAFYASHYNFEFNETMPMGPMGDYCFIDHGGEMIGAMMQKPDHVPVGMWNFYIRVPEINAAVVQVKELGGQVFNGPMEVPGGDWIINGMDPQGAMFSLVAKGS
jgi:predicted enzyme related to lactoylglutathione lyase